MKNGTLINSTDDTRKADYHYIKSPKRKNIVIAVLVLLICCLFGVMIYLLSSGKSEICTSATCVRSSMELLHYINPKVNPCDDFYLFSCGSFLENADPENPSTRSVSAFVENEIQSKIKNILERPKDPGDKKSLNQAKKLYSSCMNETTIEEEGLLRMRSIFEVFGGWPTIWGNNWKENQFNWSKALINLRWKGVKADFFFSIKVERDANYNSKYVLVIRAMTYSPSEIREEAKRLYLDYMVNIAVLFGADPMTARKDSEGVINLLLKLARIYEESAISNQTGLYDVYTLSELQYKYRSIDWKGFLNGILDPVESIRDDEVVVISEPLYLKRLMMIFKDESQRVLANFITWHSLQQLINYLPAKVLDKAYEYLAKVNGKITREPRWVTCIKATQERMDSVVSAAYIDHFYDPRSRDDIEQMILNIKIQLKMNLKESQWLDQNSKDIVIEHLLRNNEDIGSYNDLMELESHNRIYEDVFIEEDKLLQSILYLDRVNQNVLYGKLRQPFRENWLGNTSFVTGLTVHYFPKENILRFPAGIFGGAFYHPERPKYMNYGALGSIAAHEMSHVLMQAREKDSPGDLRSRWSMDSLRSYGEQLRCLSEQYSEFKVDGSERKDSKNTGDEDAADLAGVKIAYDTYINWVRDNQQEPILPGLSYSSKQLFWISSAVKHCARFPPRILERYLTNSIWALPQFRVNGPLQNLDEFATDFGCPPGSNMNPVKKCKIW